MSLDVSLIEMRPVEVYEGNITHNLTEMAEAAGLYMPLWRPDEMSGVTKAGDLVAYLKEGLAKLKAQPNHYRKFNPENGWGSYEGLVRFVEAYLVACEASPGAKIDVSR